MTPTRILPPHRLLPAAGLFALAACAGPRIEPPSGYVPLPDAGGRSFAAVSARGSTLAVSERENEGGRYADLAYWVEAFKHEKVELGRYRLSGEDEIRTKGGREGRLLDLRLGQGAAEYTWLVALFVDPSRIDLVEAGGPTAQIGPEREKLINAMKSLR